MPALIAIIGRPNVGKSTLFNRIIGERRAIESPISGTTRDPVTAYKEGENVDLLFVDTGGIEFGEKKGTIDSDVQKQARLAIHTADMILFCIDTKQDMTAGDMAVAKLLRKEAGKTPVLLLGTKADGKKFLQETDFYSLALSEYEPIFLSAIHNAGVPELQDRIEEILVEKGYQKDSLSRDPAISIAILGKPNVGKSSLVNALSNSEKLIVSDIAGTTRDSVDMEVKRDGKLFRLIDTAGIRRKSKVEEFIEEYSIMRSFASLRRADVAVLIIDATEGVTHQDKHIAQNILEAKTGLILMVNKWDLMEKGEEAQKYFINHLRNELSFLPWAPVMLISATDKKNIHQLFPLAEQITEERTKRISTGKLNAFLQEVQQLHPISGTRNTHPKIKYGSQVGTSPPHFIFQGSRLSNIHFSARRYLENRIRDAFGFGGTPIQIEFVTQKNPYVTGKKPRSTSKSRKTKKESQ